MRIKIDALDTLFFKDGKPFSMGDESWADGIFPPPPSVIYGALRSAYFGENPGDLVNVDTDVDKTKNLIIKKIYYLINDDIYYPMPNDLVRLKNGQKKEVMKLNTKVLDAVTNMEIPQILIKDSNNKTVIEEVEAVEDGIIWETYLKEYLNNMKKNDFHIFLMSDYIQSEPKVGIGRMNSTKATEEGKLYRVGMKRLESTKEFDKQNIKISIGVEFDNLSLKDNGFLKFGAESKIAKYNTIKENDDVIEDPTEGIKGNIFKIYLSTPSIFENGWKPNLSENKVLNKIDLKLISACIGKPISIGGFDMKNRIPKKMRKAVPAGSVYFYQSNKCISTFIKEIDGKSISEYNSNEGYGLSFVGGVND